MRYFLFLLLIVSSGVCFAQEPKDTGADEVYRGEFTYQIGPGDTIEIKVWRHPDLDMKVTVRPDCKIAFPLVDEIDVRNITPQDLKKQLDTKLGRILRDPQVTVNVVGFESKKIFVLGEVRQPGVYPFEGQERVLDVLAKAGGYKDDTAALKSIIVIKYGHAAKSRVIRVNLLDLVKKGDPKGNISVEPSDIVFVPKTFIANLDKFIDQFFTKTDPVLKYYLDIYDIRKPGILRQ